SCRNGRLQRSTVKPMDDKQSATATNRAAWQLPPAPCVSTRASPVGWSGECKKPLVEFSRKELIPTIWAFSSRISGGIRKSGTDFVPSPFRTVVRRSGPPCTTVPRHQIRQPQESGHPKRKSHTVLQYRWPK